MIHPSSPPTERRISYAVVITARSERRVFVAATRATDEKGKAAQKKMKSRTKFYFTCVCVVNTRYTHDVERSGGSCACTDAIRAFHISMHRERHGMHAVVPSSVLAKPIHSASTGRFKRGGRRRQKTTSSIKLDNC